MTAMLNLAYSPEVPKALIELLEHYGKRMGMALEELETIGQSLESVERFVNEVEESQAALLRDVCHAGLVRNASAQRRVARA
ncbi:MAG TPA: hypothetical protein VNZ52_02630 [Candidatus Thermoplasmatota archaeon]|nr:hypothetical protein [Candidatus Thermoplasmatota archaeon]